MFQSISPVVIGQRRYMEVNKNSAEEKYEHSFIETRKRLFEFNLQ